MKEVNSSKRKHEVDGLHSYEGQNYFKQRIICSLLSRNPVRITRFRHPKGIQPFEQSLLALVEKITVETKIEIHPKGTELFFEPGMLQGGEITHDCDLDRGIGYYLELLIAVAFFCKEPIKATLSGITNSKESTSVDYIKRNTMVWLKEVYEIDKGLDLNINKRGMIPGGGGEVYFTSPTRKELKAIQILDEGMVKRVRGVAYSAKVPANTGNRVVEASKGFFLEYLNDIYIYTDQNTGRASGNSPGFGLYLEAETTTGVIYSSEVHSEAYDGVLETPEDMAIRASKLLMDEIYKGGVVDSANQWLAVLLMALSTNDVSKVLFGRLNEYTIEFLRHMLDFFRIKYKVDWYKPTHEATKSSAKDSDTSDSEEENDMDDNKDDLSLMPKRRTRDGVEDSGQDLDDDEDRSKPITDANARVMVSCAGLGYKNLNRVVY